MSAHEIKEILLWCLGINYAVLFIWFGVFALSHDWLFHLHRRWFKLSIENFDAIHYAALAIYKIGIMLLIQVPLIALVLSS